MNIKKRYEGGERRVEKNLHILQVNEGIILDGIKLKGVREFRYIQDEGENIGTLSLKMDVRILKRGGDES